MPAIRKARSMGDLILHPECDAARHGDDPTCVCPTRRQKEYDARGGRAIPAKDPRIEAVFKAMPGATHEAGRAEREFHRRTDLACLGEDPELFTIVGSGPAAKAQARQARAVCAACPARQQCLEWALSGIFVDQVMGGLTEDERRAVNKVRKQQVRPVEDAA